MKTQVKLLSISALFLVNTALAQNITVNMDLLKENGKTAVGTVSLHDTEFGLVLTPHLRSLSPGIHGFHIHHVASCESSMKDGKTVLGGAAGGHYDPDNTNKHGFPWSKDNHKGDLPPLYVDEHGNAKIAVLAPRLTIKEVQGKSLMVHVGSDNHSDHPEPLGGGGARMVCGIIK